MVRLWRVVALCVLLAASLPADHAAASGVAQPHDFPRLVANVDGVLEFELNIPQPAIEQVTVAGRTFQRLSLPGYSAIGLPGQPELLETGVVIGLPPTGGVTVRVLEQQVEQLPGVYLLYPAPDTTVVLDPATGRPDLGAGVQTRFAWDAAAYAVDAFRPAAVAALAETAVIRQQRVARIAVRPVQYNPATGALRVYRYLRIAVTFDTPPTTPGNTTLAAPDAFDPLLDRWLLNGEQSRAWRLPRQSAMASTADVLPATSQSDAPRPGDLSRTWARLVVRQSGLYRITRADLTAAGLTELAEGDPALLEVWRNGQPVAADFLGNDDAVFDADEALLFYADARPTLYSRDTVYWLTANDAPGLRAAAVNAAPHNVPPETSFAARVRLEEDRIYRQDLPKTGSAAPSRWYWQELFNLANTNLALPLTLPDAVTTGATAELHVRLMGVSYLNASPDHQVRWAVNGHVAGDAVWDGAAAFTASFTFPAEWLVAGENVITASLPMELPNVSQDRVYLDWLELRYRRAAQHPVDATTVSLAGAGQHDVLLQGFHGDDVLVYDVTDPVQPRRLQGFAVMDGARTTDNAESVPTVTPLAADRTKRTSGEQHAVSTAARRVFLPTVEADTPPGVFSLRFGVDLEGPRSFVVTRQARLLAPLHIVADQGSQWRSPDHQADYLLVTHGSLLEAAQALAEHRRSDGMTVAVVDVQDIYDEFGSGAIDPNAIAAFVAYAYHRWQEPAPAYLLLLGDGHYDYRMTGGLARQAGLIPPYLDCYDPWLCEVASDNAFVAVSGDDRLPDLAVGRLPAADLASAARMVAKIVAYETATPTGQDWQGRLLFVADNARDASGRLDSAGNFERYSESTIAGLPASYAIERVYYDPYPADDVGESFRYRTPAATTAALLGAIDAGHLFVNYIGHAAINVWGHEWFLVGRSSVRNDVARLSNGSKLPVLLDMACLSGNFADVEREALEETLLARDGGGSVAGWGATGFGVAVGHDKLHSGFYRGLFELGLTRVGLATMAGKQYLWQQDGLTHKDLLDTFGLLGDPALQIALLPAD